MINIRELRNNIVVGIMLLTLSVFGCVSCEKSPAENTPSDTFELQTRNWKEIYLDGNSSGSYSIKDGTLNITATHQGRYGVYHTTPISGHFHIDAVFEADKNVGLALIQEKDGVPDTDNFTMLTVNTNEEGTVVVRVTDRQGGKNNVLDNTGKFTVDRYVDKPMARRAKFEADSYEHVLTGKQYSVPFDGTNKRLRIFHDNPAGFFHFYYGVKKHIRGKDAEGWMEIVPSKDWGIPGQKYYVALVALSEGQAKFDEVKAVIKPETDQDDRETGFKATRREYNWSGFFGDAIVVTFGDEFNYRDRDIKFVFWSESNYQPAWHLNNQKQGTYEFLETWIRPSPECYEPMSDRIKRWTWAEIVEDNEVRKVVHWHYVLCNPDYKVPFDDEGDQVPEADEYFTFYPDGTGIRHLVYTPKLDIDLRATHEIGELQINAGSLSHPHEFFDSPALTVLNLEGEVEDTHPGPKFSYDSKLDDWKQMIMAVHLKDEPDMFCALSTDERTPDTYSGYKIRYINAWHNLDWLLIHWPVGKRPYTFKEGGTGTWKGEVSHASLMSWGIRDGISWEDFYKVDKRGRKYREWISLIGLNETDDLNGLQDKVKSWLFPGTVTTTDPGSRFIRINRQERTILFENVETHRKCYFDIDPSPQKTVLINPVVRVNNWGPSPVTRIRINDEVLSREKYRYHLLDNRDALIWINNSFYSKTSVKIDGER